MTISEKSTVIPRKFVFLPCLKGANHEEYLDWFKELFLIKPLKGDKYYQKLFISQSEPHTAKLCLSVVLKTFGEIHRELFFLDIKVTISETSTEILRKFLFLTMFEWGKS